MTCSVMYGRGMVGCEHEHVGLEEARTRCFWGDEWAFAVEYVDVDI
jgi:hypothetical protein